MFLCVLEIIFLNFILNLTSHFLPKCSATLRGQRSTVLTPKLTFIAYWSRSVILLKYFLFHYKIINILILLLSVYVRSITIHTTLADAHIFTCMTVI